MASMVFHQSYVTQWQSLFTFISSLAMVFSFILIFTDNWLYFFAWWLFALFLLICWIIRNNKSIYLIYLMLQKKSFALLFKTQAFLASHYSVNTSKHFSRHRKNCGKGQAYGKLSLLVFRLICKKKKWLSFRSRSLRKDSPQTWVYDEIWSNVLW